MGACWDTPDTVPCVVGKIVEDFIPASSVGPTWRSIVTDPNMVPALSPQQWTEIYGFLKDIAKPNYTLTGALDWPILVFMCGLLGVGLALLGAGIAAMWNDIKVTIKGDKCELQATIAENKKERKEELAIIWKEIERCQDNCCEFGRRKGDRRKSEVEQSS